MRCLSTTVCFVLLCALFGSACHAPEPGPVAPRPPSVVTIFGNVGDAWLDAVPAKVEVVDGPASGLSTHTDEGGNFRLTGPFGGTNVTLRVSADGYTTGEFTFTVDPGGHCSCDINLLPTGFLATVPSKATATSVDH